MKKLLFHWLNPAPSPNMPYITDLYDEKFWLDWVEDGNLNQLYVSYRGGCVGRVNLLLEDDGGATLTDLIIFPPIRKRDPIFRNRGLGKAMLQETVRHERQKKVAYIWGWIQPDEFTSMEYLIEWYKRQGFMVDENDKPTIYLEL